MSGKTIIETGRLWLTEFDAEDAQHHFELNSDPEVVKYTGNESFKSIQDAEFFLVNYKAYAKWGFGRWNVIRKCDHMFLGWCGLKYHEDGDFVDLGYRLCRKFWGQGYATEAGKACVIWAQEHGIRRLAGRVMEQNKASIRVLEKLGFGQWTAYKEGASCGLISWLELSPPVA